MDVTELHDEENLLVQMQERWENFCSLDAIVDTHDQFTLEGAPRAWVVILFLKKMLTFWKKCVSLHQQVEITN